MLGLRAHEKDQWISLNPTEIPLTNVVGGVGQKTRGSLTMRSFVSAAGQGFMYQCVFPRPPQLRPPNFMMLQLHTTGLKARAIGHENEVSAWTLMTPDDKWISYRSNAGVRVTDSEDFYPPGISYRNSLCADTKKAFSERQVHLFSWVNPNWAYTAIRHYGHDDAGTTVQDMSFSLVCGDTLEPATVLSGSGTQISLVLSP